MTEHRSYHGSDAVRQAIATAARECFAADGYEKATIRGIAAAAGVDPAMVMRHFGNKAALFTAVADFELRLPDLADAPPATLGLRLAEHFVLRWKQDDAFTALLRASATHEVAADRVREIFHQQIALITARHGPDLDSAPARAGMIAGQVLGVALCRYVLRLPPLATMPDDELTAWLGDTLQRYLMAPIPSPA
ncbi:TetR family transcriptional regulator [Kribbella sp. DT2]|uniref:TetR/AcrR family transcriptional regulator n=1 Tax=Kribbella sp. DT2 TaxID=3393427 RepID=UPI003CEA31A0